MMLDELDTSTYAAAGRAEPYRAASDMDAGDWAMAGLVGAAVAGAGALIYLAATSKEGEGYRPAQERSSSSDDDWLLDPANPASPLSPLNPANPASPLSPLNPANPASPLWGN